VPKTCTLSWTLRTRADQQTAWRLLRDTDTFNRVADMGFRFVERMAAEGGVERVGRVGRFGLKLPWTERPFDFVAPHRWRTVREFSFGPVLSYEVRCELTAEGEGTRIDYTVELTPRTPLLMAVVRLDTRMLVKPKLERTLARAKRFLDGDLDEFDLPPPGLTRKAEERLAAGIDALRGQGSDTEKAGLRLAMHIREAPLRAQNMMHPLRLAKRWKLPADDVIRAMFHAVGAGVLTMHWQLVCPSCRAAKEELSTLALARGDSHCPSCEIRYDGSFPDSLAVTFRPDPAVRAIDLPIECLGSPGRTPSVVARATLEPGRTYDWPVDLLPGAYTVRTAPHMEGASLQIRRDLEDRAVTMSVGPRAIQPALLRAAPGRVEVVLRNRLSEPVRVSIQRRAVDDSVLTAGRLLEIDQARDLLPEGSISPHLDVAVARRTVLAVAVLRGGDEAVADVVAALKGANPDVLYVADTRVLACFSDPGAAISASEPVQGGRHLGSALFAGAVTMLAEGDKAVPAGRAVERAVALSRSADGGELLVAPPGLTDLDDALDDHPRRLRIDKRADGARLVAHLERARPALAPRVDTRPIAAGDVIDDRFEVREKVGSGGFGAVFAAADRHTGEDVVVKLLHAAHAADPQYVQRFFNEGLLASRLQHEHVVRTIDFGIGRGDRIFIAMERLRGRELADIIKAAGHVDAERTLRFAIDALRGLQAAHDAGLVHRDIKPANLFVCDGGPDGGGVPSVKVIDFGIAVLADPNHREALDSGRAVGTPQYMSPEQAQADASIDARSDLYSLGVVMYECLSGGFPFEGDTTIAVLLARVTDEPLPIDRVAAVPMPAGLADATMRALQRFREHRFVSADQMRLALEEVLAGRGRRDTLSGAHKKRAEMARTRAHRGPHRTVTDPERPR